MCLKLIFGLAEKRKMRKNKSSANDNDRAANSGDGGDGTNISAPSTRALHLSNIVELSISFKCGGSNK